jgi:hypothetical protein
VTADRWIRSIGALLPIKLCGLCALQSLRQVSTKDPISDAIAAHCAAHDLALAATDDDPDALDGGAAAGLAEFLNDADHACAMRGNDAVHRDVYPPGQ